MPALTRHSYFGCVLHAVTLPCRALQDGALAWLKEICISDVITRAVGGKGHSALLFQQLSHPIKMLRY